MPLLTLVGPLFYVCFDLNQKHIMLFDLSVDNASGITMPKTEKKASKATKTTHSPPQLRSGSDQWFSGSRRQQRPGQQMLRLGQLLPA